MNVLSEPHEYLDHTLLILKQKASVDDVSISNEFLNACMLDGDKSEPDKLIGFGKQVLNQLSTDGYAHKSNGRYEITFEGRFFIEKGGYKKKLEDDEVEAEKTLIEIAEKKQNEKRIIFWTKLATFVAGGLLLIELLKFLSDYLNLFLSN